ncbi:hypothetical protein HII31_08434 [Pseudocercospora fuligena]|uniref:Uncharacterized protein n=1 Tax=Pseudocercospora fuligena TaxID=685502 RepID=A0A8H6RFQ4_9PEZI|nr:hypothetical protein HII31_08434 [Pseudocercospora fuligena]
MSNATSTVLVPPTTTISSTITSLASTFDVTWSSNINNKTLLSEAQSCWTAYTEWFSEWQSWSSSIQAANVSIKTGTSFRLLSYTVYTSSTSYPTDASTYRLCDGSARADVSPMTVHSSSVTTESLPALTTISPSSPAQSCVPNVDECAIYQFGSNIGNSSYDSWVRSRLWGACGEPHDELSPCVIQGGPARLVYFPVTSPPDLCASNNPSQILTTGPELNNQLITTLGHTFDPKSAYISFETLYAAVRSAQSAGGAAVQIGPTFSNTILPLCSDEVSTNCYGRIGGTATSTAGFADLNSPVPASAYKCQNQCIPYTTSSFQYTDGLSSGLPGYSTSYFTPNPCETIYDNFNPLLAVPTKLQELVPEWKTCSLYNDWIANVIFDPPIALHTVNSANGPSIPYGGGENTVSAPAPSPIRLHTVTSGYGPTLPYGAGGHGPSPMPGSGLGPPASVTALPDSVGAEWTSMPAGPSYRPEAPPQEASRTVWVAGSITVTPVSGSPNQVNVGGTTLTAGGPAWTSGGQTVSYGQDGLHLVNGHGSSQSFSTVAVGAVAPVPTPSFEMPATEILTIGDQVHTAEPVTTDGSTYWRLGTQALSIGGPAITLSNGEVLSMDSSSLVIEAPASSTSHNVGGMIASMLGMTTSQAEPTSSSPSSQTQRSTSSPSSASIAPSTQSTNGSARVASTAWLLTIALSVAIILLAI